MLSTTYSVDAFNSLPSLRASNEVFNRTKKEHLPVLGKLIRQHGLEQRVGIQLLHTHFKLRADEKLVEAHEQTPKTERGQVVSVAAPVVSPASVVPRVWALVDSVWQPMEFAPASEVSAAEASVESLLRSENGQQFLREYAALVCALGISHVVGLGVVEAVFSVASALQLHVVETNTGERELTKTMLPPEIVDKKMSTEAFWLATAPQDGPLCSCWCTEAAGFGHTGDNNHC